MRKNPISVLVHWWIWWQVRVWNSLNQPQIIHLSTSQVYACPSSFPMQLSSKHNLASVARRQSLYTLNPSLPKNKKPLKSRTDDPNTPKMQPLGQPYLHPIKNLPTPLPFPPKPPTRTTNSEEPTRNSNSQSHHNNARRSTRCHQNINHSHSPSSKNTQH